MFDVVASGKHALQTVNVTRRIYSPRQRAFLFSSKEVSTPFRWGLPTFPAYLDITLAWQPLLGPQFAIRSSFAAHPFGPRGMAMIENESCREDDTHSKQNSLTHFASLPRWWWIAMMAACLIGLCTKGLAGEPVVTASTIQLDAILPGTTQFLPAHATLETTTSRGGRPVMVDFSAHLANFDRDAETDGWFATVALRDVSGHIATARSYATFELKVGRFAVDQVTFIAGDRVAHRWSESLKFSDDGVARIRLQLSRATKTKSELTMYRTSSLGTRPMYNFGTEFPLQRLSQADRFRYTPTNGLVGPDAPFVPVLGALSVRVSVPTEGTFDGVTVVRLNTPVISTNEH